MIIPLVLGKALVARPYLVAQKPKAVFELLPLWTPPVGAPFESVRGFEPEASLPPALREVLYSSHPLFAWVEPSEPDLQRVASRAAKTLPRAEEKRIEDTLCDVVASSSELTSVLSMLSATTKANIITVATSQDKITLSLRRVKLSEALDLISATVGMHYLRVGSAFVVGTSDRLKAGYPKEWATAHPEPSGGSPQVAPPEDPITTAIHPLSYASPEQMVATLKIMFESKGLTAAVGPAATTPTLGDRDSSGGTGISAGLVSSNVKPSGKTLILRGPASTVEAAIQAARDLDLPRAQVSIAVSIYDVTDAALNELGVSWDIGGTTFQEKSRSDINFGSFTRTPFNFGATIKALETTDKAKILASPNVSVLDEERAFVLIGNKITLPKFDGYDANKIPIYSTAEYRVGIYLQVAPSVAADGTITLAIYPQVSTVVKTTEINGASYPDIATREAQTTLRVKSGESIVLGGLLKNEELEQLEQVPILSKIPIFGELFKRRRKTKSSSQVIITLTPTLIKSDRS